MIPDVVAVFLLVFYAFGLGVAMSREVKTLLALVTRPIRCRLKSCGGRIVSTEHGLAWHCDTCGKVSGWMSNETLRQTPTNIKN